MINNIKLVLFSAAFLFLAFACGNKVDAVQKSTDDTNEDASGTDTTDDASTSGEAVTYTEDIQPILAASCLPCHSENKQGLDRNGARIGVDFDTYELAKKNAERSNAKIQRGSMPPSGSLPEEEKSLFQLWLDQGTPK